MNQNFSKAFKKNFSEPKIEVAESGANEFKVSLKLPSDKVASVSYDIANELKDSNITIVSQDMTGDELSYTLSTDLEKKKLRELIKEACYGNDMKRSDFSLTIDE